jgi:adenine-specific DNA-methyltransferase
MSTNLSKQKRQNLTSKIKAIHKYIASAKQDENTRNLLAFLSELEKEINAKKFGLVFEENREAIDETLETYTPVLTESNNCLSPTAAKCPCSPIDKSQIILYRIKNHTFREVYGERKGSQE